MELVVMVGLPAAGKSTWCRRALAGTHVVVSKDRMAGSTSKSKHQTKLIDDALGRGESVVVDNTNPTLVARADLIEQAKRHGARVIAIYVPSTVGESLERNRRREGVERVPDVAIYVAKKKLVPPSLAEGFDEVRVATREAKE
jgi:predicted kinase